MGSEFDILNIEVGTINDVDELEKLYNVLNDYLELGVNYPSWLKGVYPVRRDAESGIKDRTLFVLRVDGKIAGSIILNHRQEEAYRQAVWLTEAADSQVIVIHTLVVHPAFMKRGISLNFMNFAKYYATQKMMKSIRLDVAIQNTPAISLYEKCGYKYIGTVDLGLGYEHLKWFKLYELVL